MVKPVNQTEFDNVGWYAACLASVLEIPLSDIPHMSGMLDFENTWFDRSQAWLMTRGLYATILNDDEPATGYYIAIGSGHGGIHGVVYLDGVMVHDPHPTKIGLVGDPDTRIMIKKF